MLSCDLSHMLMCYVTMWRFSLQILSHGMAVAINAPQETFRWHRQFPLWGQLGCGSQILAPVLCNLFGTCGHTLGLRNMKIDTKKSMHIQSWVCVRVWIFPHRGRWGWKSLVWNVDWGQKYFCCWHFDVRINNSKPSLPMIKERALKGEDNLHKSY